MPPLCRETLDFRTANTGFSSVLKAPLLREQFWYRKPRLQASWDAVDDSLHRTATFLVDSDSVVELGARIRRQKEDDDGNES